MFKTSDAFLEKDTGSDVIVSAEGPKQKKRAVNSTVPETKKRTTYGHTNSTNRKKMQKKNRITHNVWVRPESFTQKHSEVYHTLKYRKKMSGCRICRSLNFLIHLQHFKRTRHHHTGRKRLKNKGVASALEQQAVPLPLFLFLFYSSITSHLASHPALLLLVAQASDAADRGFPGQVTLKKQLQLPCCFISL